MFLIELKTNYIIFLFTLSTGQIMLKNVKNPSPSETSQIHYSLINAFMNSQRPHITRFLLPGNVCVGASYLTLVEVAVIESTLPWQRALAMVLFKHRNHQHLHL